MHRHPREIKKKAATSKRVKYGHLPMKIIPNVMITYSETCKYGSGWIRRICLKYNKANDGIVCYIHHQIDQLPIRDLHINQIKRYIKAIRKRLPMN